jgi:hypothetical protein
MTDQDHTNDTVLQTGRAVIYTRPTKGTRGSASSQKATLIAFANAQGYPLERIAVYEEAGASAPDQAAPSQPQREQASRYIAGQIGKLTQRRRTARRHAKQKPHEERS